MTMVPKIVNFWFFKPFFNFKNLWNLSDFVFFKEYFQKMCPKLNAEFHNEFDLPNPFKIGKCYLPFNQSTYHLMKLLKNSYMVSKCQTTKGTKCIMHTFDHHAWRKTHTHESSFKLKSVYFTSLHDKNFTTF